MLLYYAVLSIACGVAKASKGNLATSTSTGGLSAGAVAGSMGDMPASAARDVGVAIVTSLGTATRLRRAKMLDIALGTDLASCGDDEIDEESAYVVGRGAAIGGRAAFVCDCGPADSTGESAGLAACCAHAVVVSVWRSDVGRGVAANANLLRSLRDACRLRGRSPAVVVAVHDDELVPFAGDAAEIETILSQAFMTDLSAACGGDVSFCSSIDVVSVAGVDGPSRVVGTLEERLGAAAQSLSASVDAAASQVAAAWDESRSTVSIEDVSDYVCDEAASRCKEQARASFGRWRRDIDDGRLAPRGWSSECAEVVRDALQRYADETVGYWTYRGRADKRASLESFLLEEARQCHLKQLETASSRRLRRLRGRLERSAASTAEGELDSDEAARLVADAENNFDLDASRCEVPALNLLATEQRTRFKESARRLASDFADSPAAQLLATRAEAKRAKAATKAALKKQINPQKPKGPRKPPSLSYALQLVGMLRPRGYGNLQGFCNYALGPHSLLFGYSDDRDVGGDMAATDDIPLLRFQPKITLDVDI